MAAASPPVGTPAAEFEPDGFCRAGWNAAVGECRDKAGMAAVLPGRRTEAVVSAPRGVLAWPGAGRVIRTSGPLINPDTDAAAAPPPPFGRGGGEACPTAAGVPTVTPVGVLTRAAAAGGGMTGWSVTGDACGDDAAMGAAGLPGRGTEGIAGATAGV